MLHVNYAFCLDMATRLRRGGRYLDYGCGGGETVVAGVKQGLDVYGSEVFYEGAPVTRAMAQSTGLLGERILPMNAGRLPFEDRYFDFVFHNQVFEHVPDIDLALSEIYRVLKPDGLMLSVFPCREVLWDGHCGVPFIHWFHPQSRIGYLWMVTVRRLGVGYHKKDKNPEQWAKDFIQWIHDWCHYRPLRDLRSAYGNRRFTFESHEISYIRFRLAYGGRQRWAPGFAAVEPVSRWLLRRLASMVILSSKNEHRLLEPALQSNP
jgi:SAM-dependent methyltransferase